MCKDTDTYAPMFFQILEKQWLWWNCLAAKYKDITAEQVESSDEEEEEEEEEEDVPTPMSHRI